jgi:hypothetical protein
MSEFYVEPDSILLTINSKHLFIQKLFTYRRILMFIAFAGLRTILFIKHTAMIMQLVRLNTCFNQTVLSQINCENCSVLCIQAKLLHSISSPLRHLNFTKHRFCLCMTFNSRDSVDIRDTPKYLSWRRPCLGLHTDSVQR